MASGQGGQEKTEAPTARRLRQARADGQVAQTADLAAWASIAAAGLALSFAIDRGEELAAELLARVTDAAASPEPALAVQALGDGLRGSVPVIAPVAGAAALAAVGASVLQGTVYPAWKRLKPDLKRLDPIKGAKQRFGPMAWWEGAKTLLKSVALVLVAWWAVDRLLPLLLGAGSLPLSSSLQTVAGSVAGLLRVAVAVGVVLAVADYAVQKRKTTRDLRMTKQEIKEESKNTEGNPLLKQAVRSRQVQLSRNRMMAEVARADVVVVNPTHYAVALRYERTRGAPQVVAKGVDHVARRIRERAGEHRVPMVEDVALARSLHAACEVGDEIPGELFTAVARVLAFVMQLRARGAAGGGGVHRHRHAGVDVPDGGGLRAARRQRRRGSGRQASGRPVSGAGRAGP